MRQKDKDLKGLRTKEIVEVLLETNSIKEVVMMSEHEKNTEVKSKKELSQEEKELLRAEKKAARRAGMQENGRLTLTDEFKENGYRYRVCNVLPGNIENYKSQGYEVVTHNIASGTGSLDNPECNGRPVEFEVGGAKGSMKAVWMRIREDDAEILDEIRDDMAREQADMIEKNPIPVENSLHNHPLTRGTNIGKVTKDNLR